MPEALDNLKVRTESKTRFAAIGAEWRMNNIESFDALLHGWDTLTEEQKVNAIRRKPEVGKGKRSKASAA